jgi:hypothetical protein
MGKHSSGQLVRLLIIYQIAAPLAFMMSPLMKVGQYQGWMGLMLSVGIGIGLCWFAVRLTSAFPGEPWTRYGSRILGSVPHRAVQIVLLIHCLLAGTFNIANYTDLFVSIYMPETPDNVMSGLLLVCICLVAQSRIQSVIYLADGLFLLIYGAALLVLPFIVRDLNLHMSVALITHWSPAIAAKSTFFVQGWFGEITMYLLFAHHFKQAPTMIRSLFLAQICAALLIFIYWAITLLLFGPSLASHLRFPIVDVIRFVSVGDIVENLDPILIGIWSASLLIKTSLLLYLASKLFVSLIGYRNRRSIVILLATTLYAFSMQFLRHPSEFQQFLLASSTSVFVLGIQWIPALYYTVAKLRGIPSKSEA